MAKKVVVLGGGVGGMSAAHELVERGFEVEVFESRRAPGGKARSIPVRGTGKDGRPDLPGEHGFRFFPGFYKHLPDTMKRIPFGDNRRGVYDNLVQATEYLMAVDPARNLTFLVRFPESVNEWREAFHGYFNGQKLGIPRSELDYFVELLLVILTSCKERRMAEYESKPWWDFIAAGSMGEAYRLFLAKGLTRSLVAMKAELASTRTVGDILVQLLLDIYAPGIEFDRVLDGPTTERWIDPWLVYLRQRGVNYQTRTQVKHIRCQGRRIASVTVCGPDGEREVIADHYISALPVEQLGALLTPDMLAADPSLAGIKKLQVAWMNGFQIYLKQDVPFVNGHINFVASPWCITAISQQQFWPRRFTHYGDGTVHGCLSIDISDWESPGIVYGKPARELTSAEQIATEVIAQIRAALDAGAAAALAPSNIHSWFLDPDIVLGSGPARNQEPLLINTAGSWKHRPEASGAIENLFLAADFVRTYTDLATMEAANEAARRAVNALLARSGSRAEPCHVWRLEEPLIFAPLREYDRVRFDLGLPNSIYANLPHPPPPPTYPVFVFSEEPESAGESPEAEPSPLHTVEDIAGAPPHDGD